MEFFKYQSLGNDFILLDAIASTSSLTHLKPSYIKSLCHRHFGIGADGILTIYPTKASDVIQCDIFNSDGSTAELCINGIRCIANYLFIHHHFPNQFTLKMGGRLIHCHIEGDHQSNTQVTLNTGRAQSYQTKTIQLSEESIDGDCVEFSNPHFIIFKQANDDTVHREGSIISTHTAFKNRTNVAYVNESQSKEKIYDVSFYERGSGITLSCGSGASAVIWALYKRGEIQRLEKIQLCTQGGSTKCYIDHDNNIIQTADAHLVFKGSILNKW